MTIPNSNNTTCLATKDTLYYSNCGKRTYEVHPIYGNNCFEPTTETTKYIEGVGYFYNKFVANAPNYGESYVLNYYIKQASSCPIGVFINEQKNTLNITNIFPNPSKGLINIVSKEQLFRFDIFSLEGKIVLSGYIDNYKINIESLNPATYILNILYSEDLKVKIVKIVKE